MSRAEHKGWHSRGYLPHLDAAGEIQMVGFRLADAVPARLIERWRRELMVAEEDCSGGSGLPRSRRALLRRIMQFEDAGRGSCVLRDPVCAQIVGERLVHHDGSRYRLIEWCVMPNHVHVVLAQHKGQPLGRVVQGWKNYTARRINRFLRRAGRLWSPDYFDRYIRDEGHLLDACAYVRNNPVKAGLCKEAADWPFGSAAGVERGTAAWPGEASREAGVPPEG